MNPIFTAIRVAALRQRLRKCPKCKREQVAPAGKARESVRCQYCRELIPPKRRDRVTEAPF